MTTVLCPRQPCSEPPAPHTASPAPAIGPCPGWGGGSLWSVSGPLSCPREGQVGPPTQKRLLELVTRPEMSFLAARPPLPRPRPPRPGNQVLAGPSVAGHSQGGRPLGHGRGGCRPDACYFFPPPTGWKVAPRRVPCRTPAFVMVSWALGRPRPGTAHPAGSLTPARPAPREGPALATLQGTGRKFSPPAAPLVTRVGAIARASREPWDIW